MKQISISKNNQLEIKETPVPLTESGCVLVRVMYSIAGSGLSFISKKQRTPNSFYYLSAISEKAVKAFKVILGKWKKNGNKKNAALFQFCQGFAGIVVDTGKNTSYLKTGDYVACSNPDMETHGEYLLVPEDNVCLLPKNVKLEYSAFAAMGGIALEGVNLAGIIKKTSVVILGLGTFGLLTAKIFQHYGFNIIGADSDKTKVQEARQLGIAARVFIRNRKRTYSEALAMLAGEHSIDGIVFCCEPPSDQRIREIIRFNPAIRFIHFLDSKSGWRTMQDFERHKNAKNECPFVPAKKINRSRMAEFLEIVGNKKICLATFVKRECLFDDFIKNWKILFNDFPEDSSILLDMCSQIGKEELVNKVDQRKIILRQEKPPEGKVSIGVIGLGNQCRKAYLPMLSRMGEFRIEAIAARSGLKALKTAEEYDARFCTTDVNYVITDPSIDAVVIAGNDDHRARMAVLALEAGKHVFLQNPIGSSIEECKMVLDEMKKGALIFAIDYYRRYSPLYLDMKKKIMNSSGPIDILCRISANYSSELTSKEHFTGDETRFIRRISQFFSLFSDLVGRNPLEISATGDYDCMCVVLMFEDKSKATILYTKNANADLNGEYIEVHRGGVSFLLNNFLEMRYMGISGKDYKHSDKTEALFNECLEFYRSIRSGKDMPVGINDGIIALSCAESAIESCRKGESVKVKICL
ncbi:MAG: Gfo/Idh/MocA family oxidoreductase [Candidatus Theseobacter exili]|nr:Gfo/Idh/MocA family oxidoreductase [Candidatus Theseobacter exili]